MDGDEKRTNTTVFFHGINLLLLSLRKYLAASSPSCSRLRSSSRICSADWLLKVFFSKYFSFFQPREKNERNKFLFVQVRNSRCLAYAQGHSRSPSQSWQFWCHRWVLSECCPTCAYCREQWRSCRRGWSLGTDRTCWKLQRRKVRIFLWKCRISCNWQKLRLLTDTWC